METLNDFKENFKIAKSEPERRSIKESASKKLSENEYYEFIEFAIEHLGQMFQTINYLKK